VLKSNGGQLSCFNAVVGLIRDDDLVTLLDADDLYPADYLATLLERYERRQSDLCFCEPTEFTEAPSDLLETCRAGDQADFLLPCSSALTRRLNCWIGSPTSGVSLTGKLYRQLFPYPHESDWITRADDIVVLGASVLGARKLYLPSVRFGYRVHGNNHFFGCRQSPADEVVRHHRLEKLYGWFCDAQHIAREAPVKAALAEHALVPAPLRQRFNLPDPLKLLPRGRRRVLRVRRFLASLFGRV
jgi:hypothetical protein